MTAPAVDHRELHRVPCRIAVTAGGPGSNLGQTRDLSLAGAFIATPSPLPEGQVLPLALDLPEGRIEVRAEVVRVTDEGMGLRFKRLDEESARKLKKHVARLTDVEHTRRTAEELLEADRSVIHPIEDPDRIAGIFRPASGRPVSLTLIPSTQQVRLELSLVALEAEGLHLSGLDEERLQPGEEVLGLHNHDFVSYYFRSRVLRAEGRDLWLEAPVRLTYSERRGARREGVEGGLLELPLPWSEQPARWPVWESSRGGLSFRAELGDFVGLPGNALEGAVFVRGDQREALQSPVIKHVTLVSDEPPWLRVGIAHGVEQVRLHETPLVEVPEHSPTWFSRTWARIKAGLGFLWHDRIKPGEQQHQDQARPVTLRNDRGQRLVGLLDRSFPEGGRTAMPVVVVVPGYGGRKEQSCALAKTLVHNFRRHHLDLAVLRLDGTNNLGESEKSPGHDLPGRECLDYTVSGVASDLLGALAWVRDNPHFQATDIVVVSVSFGSIGVRRALTRPEAEDVALWVAFRGAPDAQNAVLHVSGHVDIVGNYLRGVPNGVISLVGCMVDADAFCEDLAQHGGGSLDDARQDMAAIPADVTWILGASDAWMDPQRARELMRVAGPPGTARVVKDMPGGHMPQNSAEALEEFRAITELVWLQLHGLGARAELPPMGWVGSASAREWKRVRREPLASPTAWWRDYLLGEEGPGFDVLTLSEAYTSFTELQADLLQPRGQRVLDLGTGTGNLAVALQAREPAELQGADLVPEALERAAAKLGPEVSLRRLDLEGSPRLAMKRWVRGDLHELAELARRIPGLHQQQARRLAEARNGELHALLRGREGDVQRALRQGGLPPSDAPVVEDLQLLARLARGRLDESTARSSLKRLPASSLDGPLGLPWPDGRFDRVSLSLVLSYLDHPRDVLFEARRVLTPGGLLLASSMKLDADSSKLFVDLVEFIETAEPEQLPAEHDRETLLRTARGFLDNASELFRCVEEGLFRFYRQDELLALMQAAGFEDVRLVAAFGQPEQALVAVGRKPLEGA